jgi:hypothetical protein
VRREFLLTNERRGFVELESVEACFIFKCDNQIRAFRIPTTTLK